MCIDLPLEPPPEHEDNEESYAAWVDLEVDERMEDIER